MADPTVVAITPADTWVKVATNVTYGAVEVVNQIVEYICTHRDTGNPAPTTMDDGVDLEGYREIRNSVGIDVYVMARNGVGSVRVS
jgi:hypothetical protein